MWNPFARNYRSAKAAAQLRTTAGTFSSPTAEAARPQAVQATKVENEVKALSTLLEVQKGMVELNKATDEAMITRRNAVQAEAQALAEVIKTGEAPKTDWLDVAQVLLPEILPRLDILIGHLAARSGAAAPRTTEGMEWATPAWTGSPTPVNPSPSPIPTPSPAQNVDIVGYIRQLAEIDGSTKKGKAALAGLKHVAGSKVAEGLERQGLSVDMLRQAVDNLEHIVPDEKQLTIQEATE